MISYCRVHLECLRRDLENCSSLLKVYQTFNRPLLSNLLVGLCLCTWRQYWQYLLYFQNFIRRRCGYQTKKYPMVAFILMLSQGHAFYWGGLNHTTNGIILLPTHFLETTENHSVRLRHSDFKILLTHHARNLNEIKKHCFDVSWLFMMMEPSNSCSPFITVGRWPHAELLTKSQVLNL